MLKGTKANQKVSLRHLMPECLQKIKLKKINGVITTGQIWSSKRIMTVMDYNRLNKYTLQPQGYQKQAERGLHYIRTPANEKE